MTISIKKGTKFVIKCETGFCGSGTTYFYVAYQDITNTRINELAYEIAINHAESYGIYPECDDEDNEDDDTEYSSNIDGSWYIYDEETHECKRPGGAGGDFMEIS